MCMMEKKQALLISGVIVVLLEEPPDTGGDKITIAGETYTAIWPGKTNYGRTRQNWWVAAGTQHPHCVLGDQMVATNKLGAVTKAFYEGFVIEITTAGGNRMTVTENHPVLTPDGFIPAKFFKKGSYVLTSSDPNRLHKIVNPYNHQRPTRVENLFTSVRHSFGMSSSIMEITDKDFYGDGRFFNSDVDVVFTDSFLWNYFKTLFFEDFNEMLFCNTLLFNSSIVFKHFGSSFQCLQRYGFATSSILRLLNHLITLYLRHIIDSKLHSLRTTTDVDTEFVDTVTKGIPTHSNFSSKFIHRFTSNIYLNNSIREGGISDTHGLIIPSRVISVVRRFFSGHVYDLQDDMYGLYTCNGVLVKNCRCTWVKHVPGFEKWDDKFRVAMQQAKAEGARKQKVPDDYSSTLKATPWN